MSTLVSPTGVLDEPREDPRTPDVRLRRLLDPRSAVPLGAVDGSGVGVVRGLVHGSPVYAYCTDGSRHAGALSSAGARRIAWAIDEAVRHLVPVIGLWHSGGARLGDGVESLDGVGSMFAAMTRASGRVPQLSVVLGPAAGAAAYGPALTDLVVMAETGRMFVTGPNVVRSVTGEDVDMESLGGLTAHSRLSGVVHLATTTEEDACQRARDLTDLLARPGHLDLSAAAGGGDPSRVLPASERRAYDVRPLVRELLDDRGTWPALVELQGRWAPNMTTGLGRLAGRTVGVLANNPLHKGGCIDSLGAEKAARFVQMCDALGVPLLVVVDVPGYLPGARQEWEGVIRRGAKLLHAFASAVVPRVTLVTRKAYGGAYVAMNSRALGASAVFAWPDADVAVMGAEAAVGVLQQRRLAEVADGEREELRRRLVAEHRVAAGGVPRAVALGVVDEVIDARDTRPRLAAALAAAPALRGAHGNIPL